jgi:lysophospholipase L1-like esterase
MGWSFLRCICFRHGCLFAHGAGAIHQDISRGGSWQLVLNELKTPGYKARYVLIEMGHNDKNADPAIGTRLGDEFPANLARFVTEARATEQFPCW